MIALAQAGYLALLLVVAAMAWGVWWLGRWRARARRDFAGPQAGRWQAALVPPSLVLVLVAAVLVVLSAARPQWGIEERVREREGIDFVIALDVSQSMEAADVSPSRLAVAQEELVRLVEAERGSRVGLVLFAGTAFLRSPLTTDTQAMVQLIRRAGDEAGLVRAGSDLGAALDVAGLILAASEENRGKAVILVSDGEDFVGTYATRAAALAEQGVVIHTVGVGTVGGAQLFDRTPAGVMVPKLGPNGQPVITRLDPATLQTIAGTGGGRYQLIDTQNRLVDLGFDLRRLDPTPLGAERLETPVERYQLFLGMAVLLLVASWFVPGRLPLVHLPYVRRMRPQSGLAVVVLALLIGACAGDSVSNRNREANRLHDAGDYQAALAIYQDLLAARPDIDELSYNAGNALHRLEAYERAAAETQRALPPTEVRLGAMTYYALGNHLLHLGRFEEAYFAYRNSLLLDSRDVDAKHNLELTLLLLGRLPPPEDQATGPGEPGDSGDGTPQPGEGTPEPGGGTPEPGDDGSPQPNGSPGPPTPGATPSQAGRVERTLEEALAGIEEELTFEQAVEILQLLQERQQRPRPAPGGGGAGPDW